MIWSIIFYINSLIAFITRDVNLENIKFYSKLNLKGGVVDPTSYKSCLIVFKEFVIEITRSSVSYLKENEFEVRIRDTKKIGYHPFIGNYYETIKISSCKKSKLLSTIQDNIDFGYKKFIKLKAFL